MQEQPADDVQLQTTSRRDNNDGVTCEENLSTHKSSSLGCETTSIMEALGLEHVGSKRLGCDRGQDGGVSLAVNMKTHKLYNQ